MSRMCYLSPHQLQRLDLACQPLVLAYGWGTYLVGSVMYRADFRDVDVRTILSDKRFDRLFGKGVVDDTGGAHADPQWALLCSALSHWLSDVSGLSVDFQFQRQSEANAVTGDLLRNPLGHGRPMTRIGDQP